MNSIIKFFTKFFKKPVNYKLKCGYIPDEKDDRDYIKVTANAIVSSESFSLLNYKSIKILNQKDTNACGGYAAAVGMNILLRKQLELGKLSNFYLPELSPTWIYYNARKLDPLADIKRDEGCQLRNVMKALKNVGCLSINYMNYDYPVTKDAPKISSKATKIKIHDYYRIEMDVMNPIKTITELKTILSVEKLPIIAGVILYEDQIYDLQYKGKLNIVENLNNKMNTRIGGHAICITGYYSDKNGKTWFECVNSWGENYGDKGLFYFPEDMIGNYFYIGDLWTFDKSYF